MKMIKNPTLFILLGLALCFQSCTDDEEPSLFSETFTSTNGITIEMTWSVNGNAAGETLMDIDLLIDDITQGDPGEYEFSSSIPNSTESLDIESAALDGDYFLGVYLYEFETGGGLSSGTANYSIKIYERGNPIGSSVTVTGQIDDTVLTNLKSYANFKLAKNGIQYTVSKLASTQAIENGY